MNLTTSTGPADLVTDDQPRAGHGQPRGGTGQHQAGNGQPRGGTGQPPEGNDQLLGIGAAATRLGVSERALRYYQQLGLLVPACTPGGLRRYSRDDIARVERIRELQTLLGLNLDEIAIVLRNEDRMAEIRLTYHDERTSDDERRRLTREGLTLQQSLRCTVEAKRVALESFLADLDARIRRIQDLLAGPGNSGAQ